MDAIRILWRSRDSFIATVFEELQRKFAGSTFGLGWLMILPLLFLAFYSTVYIYVFRVQPAEMSQIDYVFFIYIGLMPFLSFSESMTAGAGSLQVNRAVLLNTIFPAELIPLRVVTSVQATFVVGLLIAIGWTVFAGKLSAWIVFLPFIVIFQTMFLAGLAWILAPLYLVFRDLGQLLNFATLGLLIISPIAFPADALTGPARVMLVVNPLYYYLECYRALLFYGNMPDLRILAVTVTFSLAFFFVGFAVFRRVKTVVADYA